MENLAKRRPPRKRRCGRAGRPPLEFLHLALIYSSPDRGRWAPLRRPRGGPFSARLLRRAITIRQCRVDRFQDIFHFAVYLRIPKPQHLISLLVQISGSQGILTLLLPLPMVTTVEFDNQALREAAEIGEVRTNPVLSAEFRLRNS